ncbi:hypothetical protein FHR83_006375 [Actinoplanes campanulatus]|uniref:SMI1/KNR4 family protein n=1 Tax=Actinoplanes campanulatus TaxID=113559 RepID=A0A7W5AM82_9ACTN|nr:hypothetical protein [Actinoplanes campanulatus]MBB3098676.1 hypothetical protein [Actinoplanes campanulatus]GGN36453.1 hypothetical protein GCM10010109_61430 [Actinoplanes campanulatus]GID39366.1 hypothetical protein Aca09nite_58720 [Actinoplanes campanulatus]
MSELGVCMVIDMLEGLDELAAGDRRRGWEFLRTLTAAFGRPVVESDGVDPALVQVGEDRIGFALPAALREAYLLFGRRRDLTAAQDSLVSPQSLDVDPDGVLVFRVEAQGCASWGVPARAIGQEDPPVVVNVGDGWEPYSDRLSVALVEMVMSEAMFSADERNVDNRELDDTTNALVSAVFEPLPLPVLPFWAGMDGPGVRWFAGHDVLLRNDGETWLWVHGRTPDAVQAVRERLSGEWLTDSNDEGEEELED